MSKRPFLGSVITSCQSYFIFSCNISQVLSRASFSSFKFQSQYESQYSVFQEYFPTSNFSNLNTFFMLHLTLCSFISPKAYFLHLQQKRSPSADCNLVYWSLKVRCRFKKVDQRKITKCQNNLSCNFDFPRHIGTIKKIDFRSLRLL